jgi:hypothetical protein
MNFNEIKAAIENGGLSLEQIRELTKVATAVKKSHADYQPHVSPEHVNAKRDAIKLILNQVLGLNAARKEALKLLANGSIVLLDMVKPEEKDAFNAVQLAFVNKSLKRLTYFMPNKARTSDAFTPKMILDAMISAATMSGPAFANRCKAMQHDAEKTQAKTDDAQAA